VEVADLWPIVEPRVAAANLTVAVPTRDDVADLLGCVARLEGALTEETEVVSLDGSRDDESSKSTREHRPAA
jgi:hypothetical protein